MQTDATCGGRSGDRVRREVRRGAGPTLANLGLVGRSRAMAGLRERIEGVAPLWVPVLLCGEPGSGRATVAQLLHALGPSARGEWVRVDAAELAPERPLPFVGSVYLEGLERMPLRTLRWWRERVRRSREPGEAGGVRWSASTPDVDALLAAPGFDRELHMWLARFALRIPPLRERLDDLAPLVSHLCARLGRAVGRERVRVSAAALERLRGHHWPGNVRELEEVLARAIAFARDATLGRALIESVLAERGESVEALRARRAANERASLLAELRASGGNVARAAEKLGRSRTSVYRLIERHGIALSWERRTRAARR